MRPLCALIAAALLFSASYVRGEEETAWYKVKSDAGGVAAMFPGKVKTTPQPNGEQFTLQADDQGTAYLLQWSKFEKRIDATDEASVKPLLDATQKSMLAEFKDAKLLASNDMLVGKHYAREISFEIPDGVYSTKIIISGDRVYQISVFGTKESLEGDDVAAFWSSIRFMDQEVKPDVAQAEDDSVTK